MANFKEVDMKNWSRRDTFLYFTKIMPSVYTLTVETDVTELVKYHKESGISFFAMCLWLISKAVNEVPSLRYGYEEKVKLVQYDEIIPVFPIFHKDTESCTMICTDTAQKFSAFYEEFNTMIERARTEKKFFTSKYPHAPANTFNLSVEPRVHFTGFSLMHPIGERPMLRPIIELGKYKEIDGKLFMPLAFQEHHACADGFHVGAFFDKVNVYFENPQKYIMEK